MRWFSVLMVVGCVAACGADGEPVQPTRNASVTLSNSGVSGDTNLGVTQGPVSLSLGLGF